MPTFVWGEEFYTGLGAVDEQHHALIDLFNGLSESLETGNESGEANVQLAFSQLMDYTKYHFSIEEALMREASLDSRYVGMHLRLHDEFAEQVCAMWGARASMSNPAEVFLSFLTGWLCLHVLGVDQSMARQIERVRNGETPERAFEIELLRPKDKSAEAMIKALRNTYHVVSRLSLDLITANQTLERRVIERTAELQKSNEALVVANQKLEVYSQTDGLLGIANRKYFDTRLKDEWNRALREQAPLGLLMIDVDFFKNYNDHYGHQAGDACLQADAKAGARGRSVGALWWRGVCGALAWNVNTGLPQGCARDLRCRVGAENSACLVNGGRSCHRQRWYGIHAAGSCDVGSSACGSRRPRALCRETTGA